MKEFGLTFDHFGLAVREPEAAFRYLAGLGYREGATCYDPHQCVNLAMRHHEQMPDVEVIWPGEVPSPIDKILKRTDSMVYHLCYRSSDPAASIADIEASGIDVLPITEPAGAPLFDGLEVSFYSVSGFGVIEIIHGA
jgi:hypothetical protein